MRKQEGGIRIAVLLGSVVALVSVNTFQNVLLYDNFLDNNPTKVTSSAEELTSSAKESVDTVPMNDSPAANKDSARIPDLQPKVPSILPLCRRDQLTPGQWKPVTLDAPPYVSRTVHLRCPIPYDYENPEGAWQSWNWDPLDTTCHFAAWNATEFCTLLPFATVSVLGDSTSWEQFSSLVQLLGGRVHQTLQHVSRLEGRNVVLPACRINQQGTRFVFRNDAQLTPAMVLDSISNDFPIVLILNRGAHYVNDTVLADEINDLLPVLSEWQAACDRFELTCHLFWRTAVPGHVNCRNFTAPVNDLNFIEAHIKSRLNYDDERTWEYHWQDYDHQNQLVLHLLQEYAAATGLQYQVIDAYALNVLRPDGHRWHQDDCLHNCYPGKMDVYNQLLLHFLKMQRTPADSRQMILHHERLRAMRSTNHTTLVRSL